MIMIFATVLPVVMAQDSGEGSVENSFLTEKTLSERICSCEMGQHATLLIGVVAETPGPLLTQEQKMILMLAVGFLLGR